MTEVKVIESITHLSKSSPEDSSINSQNVFRTFNLRRKETLATTRFRPRRWEYGLLNLKPLHKHTVIQHLNMSTTLFSNKPVNSKSKYIPAIHPLSFTNTFPNWPQWQSVGKQNPRKSEAFILYGKVNPQKLRESQLNTPKSQAL